MIILIRENKGKMIQKGKKDYELKRSLPSCDYARKEFTEKEKKINQTAKG